jgi:hypothetical protein
MDGWMDGWNTYNGERRQLFMIQGFSVSSLYVDHFSFVFTFLCIQQEANGCYWQDIWYWSYNRSTVSVSAVWNFFTFPPRLCFCYWAARKGTNTMRHTHTMFLHETNVRHVSPVCVTEFHFLHVLHLYDSSLYEGVSKSFRTESITK